MASVQPFRQDEHSARWNWCASAGGERCSDTVRAAFLAIASASTGRDRSLATTSRSE